MIRPVFVDEILGAHNGNIEPQYDVVSGGNVAVASAGLRLRNPVTQAGTPLNALNMNNMFDFDNIESMRGHRKTTTFEANGNIIESITRTGQNIVTARRTVSFPNASSVRTVTTIFADNGTDVLRQTTVDTAVGGTVTETVS